jgi:hypothetical protein
VVGSEVPNLLEPGASSTLVVSQDVDLAIRVDRAREVKKRLPELEGFHPSPDEPSVWLPESADRLEVNFLGLDPSTRDTSDSYVLDDPDFPLMVFGLLSLVKPGRPVEIEGLPVPVPRIAGLLLEKLATERSGEKGDRDLLVALGLLLLAKPADLDELDAAYRGLSLDLRHTVRSNLTILGGLERRRGMPDPGPHRATVAELQRRLDAMSEGP